MPRRVLAQMKPNLPPSPLYFLQATSPPDIDPARSQKTEPEGGQGPHTFMPLLLGPGSSGQGRNRLHSLLVGVCVLGPRPLPRPHPGASWPHPLFSAGTRRKGGRVPAARPQLGRMPRGWTRAGHGASRADPEATAVGQGEEFRPLGKEEQGGVPGAGS